MGRNLKNSTRTFLRHWWMGKRAEAGRTTWNNETLTISASTKAWIKTSAWVCRCSLPTEVKPFARRAPCDLKVVWRQTCWQWCFHFWCSKAKARKVKNSRNLCAAHLCASIHQRQLGGWTFQGLRHNFPSYRYQLTLGGPGKISVQSCCPNPIWKTSLPTASRIDELRGQPLCKGRNSPTIAALIGLRMGINDMQKENKKIHVALKLAALMTRHLQLQGKEWTMIS